MRRAAAAALAAAADTAAAAAVETPPHIVFFLADDVGWNAPSWHNPKLHTPALAALRAAGVELSYHYSYKFCAPTRAAFLTGRLPYKLTQTDTNQNPNFVRQGLDLSYTTIATALQRRGYATHHVGKWHAGFYRADYLPVRRGFNSSLAFLGGGEDHYNQVSLGAVCQYPPRYLCSDAGRCVVSAMPWAVSLFECTFGCGAPPPPGTLFACRPYTGGPRCVPAAENGTSLTDCAASCGVLPTPEVDLWDGEAPAAGLVGEWTGALFAQRAVAVVRRHARQRAGTPLFLYYAMHDAHGSLQAPARLVRLYAGAWPPPESTGPVAGNVSWAEATYWAMITAADEQVGNVTAALRRAGLWARTLVVWTSDNGAEIQDWTTLGRCARPRMLPHGGFTAGPPNGGYCAGGGNAPLRGAKDSNWEGGIRVPTVVAGPALPAAARGRVLRGLASIADWYATLVAGVAGGDARDPGGAAESDSADLWPWLAGRAAASPRTEIVHDHTRYNVTDCPGADDRGICPGWWGALRSGPWKLFVSAPNETHATWYGEFAPNASGPQGALPVPELHCPVWRPCLFHIDEDPTEHYDVAALHPEVVARMLVRWHELNEGYHPPWGDPPEDREAYCKGIAHRDGFMGPFAD